MADRDRIDHAIKTKRKDTGTDKSSDYCPYRHGQVIIAKAFMGESEKAPDYNRR